MTKEENIERIAILEDTWKTYMVEIILKLGAMEDDTTIDVHTKVSIYTVWFLGGTYFVLEVPKEVTDGWAEGDIYSYKEEKLDELVVMLTEAKY